MAIIRFRGQGMSSLRALAERAFGGDAVAFEFLTAQTPQQAPKRRKRKRDLVPVYDRKTGKFLRMA